MVVSQTVSSNHCTRVYTQRFVTDTCDNPHDIAVNNNGFLASTVLDFISDMTVIILPYPLYKSLRNVRLRHKIIVFGVFSLSIFMVFLGIFRAVLFVYVNKIHSLWLLGLMAIQWGQLFATVSVLIAILPALRLFFTEEQKRTFAADIRSKQQNRRPHGLSDDTTIMGDGDPTSVTVSIIQEKSGGPDLEFQTSALDTPVRKPSIILETTKAILSGDIIRKGGSTRRASECVESTQSVTPNVHIHQVIPDIDSPITRVQTS
jgi:hypothetical protein